MLSLLLAVRKVDQRKACRTRKPARRQRTIGNLEQCEDRTLLTAAFGVTAAPARSSDSTPSSTTIPNPLPIQNISSS